MTENELVAALRGIVEDGSGAGLLRSRSIVAGIGDDAAVWQPSRSHLSVVTTDALVDGVHFLSATLSPEAIGHRALAANLSDIAAMGARPVLITVALGVAPGTSEAWIIAAYSGMAALAREHRARIVGGDIVRSPVLSFALTVVGEVSRSRLKLRSGGKAGDVIAVTGPLGASRAGLELERNPVPVAEAARREALAAFEKPAPRLREGRWLAASTHVHAMMDCSDGISTDLARLASASRCGANLTSLPIHPAAEAVARAAGDDPAHYALDGGEDFELIVAVERRAFSHLAGRYTARFGTPLVALGTLRAESGLSIRDALGERELCAAGYDHLAAP